MKGKVHIKISNIANKITYEFTLNRNITVIEGNSATGKTVLISLIRAAKDKTLQGRAAKDKTLQGFIRVDCDYPCIAFSSDEYDWERRIKETENSIIFFDEAATYVKTEEFAKAIQNTSTYYVIVNRESLSNLPYSVDEIYGIKESGKYGGLETVVNKFYRIYSKYDNFKDNKDISVDNIITEDKKAGYQFFSKVYDCNCAFSSDEYDWERRIKETENSIIFFDEDATYVKTEEFAKAIQNTSNYYVIVNRESLSNLPYSVDEIYGIKESGRYGGLEPVVNKFYRIYSKYDNFKDNKDISVDNIITEDKKAGYQFFSKVYDCNCFSSGGNSSIIKPLEEISDNEDTLIVADGAAFGQVKTLEEFTRYRNNIKVFLPESFEYLILSAKIFGNHNKMIEKILENPSYYIDSKKFISWERYFTSLVEDISKYYAYASYDKTNLKRFYQEGINKDY